jgi:hypothetical protein
VPTIGLGDLIAGGAIPIPDVLNMDDVRGTNSRLLVGTVEMVERRKSTLLVALHGEQRRLCREPLGRAGYRSFSLGGGRIEGGKVLEDEIYALPASVG